MHSMVPCPMYRVPWKLDYKSAVFFFLFFGEALSLLKLEVENQTKIKPAIFVFAFLGFW